MAAGHRAFRGGGSLGAMLRGGRRAQSTSRAHPRALGFAKMDVSSDC